MNRWTVRILGLFLLLALFFMMANLQQKLVQLQKAREAQQTPAPTTTTAP
jgi:hypothetical protein